MSERIAPDQRVYLKIKLKSLAAESRIIRDEAHRRPPRARQGLTNHRKHTIRKEARDTLLAYGFLRGRTREQIETRYRTKPRYSNVFRMVERYGSRAGDLKDRFDAWWGGV